MERRGEKMQKFYAHSVEGKPKSEWQGRQLLELIERFLRFERLRNAGLWHDLGKYIEGLNIKNVGHSLGEVGS